METANSATSAKEDLLTMFSPWKRRMPQYNITGNRFLQEKAVAVGRNKHSAVPAEI